MGGGSGGGRGSSRRALHPIQFQRKHRGQRTRPDMVAIHHTLIEIIWDLLFRLPSQIHIYTFRKVLMDFAVCDGIRFCKALYEVKFRDKWSKK